jgi:hypothetical protein
MPKKEIMSENYDKELLVLTKGWAYGNSKIFAELQETHRNKGAKACRKKIKKLGIEHLAKIYEFESTEELIKTVKYLYHDPEKQFKYITYQGIRYGEFLEEQGIIVHKVNYIDLDANILGLDLELSK